MKLLITERQLIKIIKESPIIIPDDEKLKRLNTAKELAKNCKNPREFELKNKSLWYFIRTNNLIDDVFPNRQKYKPDNYWNELTISQESEKYESRREFRNANQLAYNKASELGILDFLFPIVPRVETPKKNYYVSKKDINKPNKDKLDYWTPEKLEQIKNKYKSRSELRNSNKLDYLRLKDFDLLDKIFLKSVGWSEFKYSLDYLKKLIDTEYDGDLKKLKKDKPFLYRYIRRHGYLNEFTNDNQKSLEKKYDSMSDEELINFAKDNYISTDQLWGNNKTLFNSLKSKRLLHRF